jgi:hypothetical protein
MKLWAFGDSFTEPFSVQCGDQLIYHKWKGHIPKNFIDFISENLQVEKINKAKGGSSNRTILSTFINNMDYIEDNDIVIIGWTSLNRFRIIDSEENFFDVISPQTIIKALWDSPTIRHSIDEYLIIREHPLFFNELMEYMDLINKSLPKCQIVYWTWHHMNIPSYKPKFQELINLFNSKLVHNGPIEDIITETQGVIQDFHYSENGHRYLAEKILKKIS